ncbi:ATP-binding protein [candidate division KSB1 bacterium]|nr:ATP-binding protein [candidate division KSB1 bacterium]
MSDHVVNIQKIGQHNDIIKISIDKGVEVTEAMPFLVQLLDNCFKNGMYKVIFDMERIKFPSPSFIAYLIEITAQTRRVGGNVILIRMPHAAINNFVTFSPLNYLAAEESEDAAIEELEILTPKSRKPSEPATPLLMNEILKPAATAEPLPKATSITETKIEARTEKAEPVRTIETAPEPVLPEEEIVKIQSEENRSEKTEKFAIEQNIFRLKEPTLPVKEIISEVAAGKKMPATPPPINPKNTTDNIPADEEAGPTEPTMSRDEVKRIIAELRKQIEQHPADMNLPDPRVFMEIAESETTTTPPQAQPSIQTPVRNDTIPPPEVIIPAKSILNSPEQILMKQTKSKNTEKPMSTGFSQPEKRPADPEKLKSSSEDKNVRNKIDEKAIPEKASNIVESKEKLDPGKPKAFRIRVKSQIESLYKICDFVINLASQAGIPEKERGKIKVTVYEASLNVIEHAYHSDPDEWIVVTVQVDSQRFIIIIQDWGESFNFDDSKKYDVNKAVQDRKTGGFGLFIIQRAMDQVQYKTDPLNGNRLILIKNLEPFKK